MRIMEGFIMGKYFGLLGVALLLVSYIRMLGFEFLTPSWANIILALSVAALIAFILAEMLSRRRWYWGVLFAFLSVILLFAEIGG